MAQCSTVATLICQSTNAPFDPLVSQSAAFVWTAAVRVVVSWPFPTPKGAVGTRVSLLHRSVEQIHIRPPFCLNLSPVLGIGFSSLNAHKIRSSKGSKARKIPLHKYAAHATIVAINASIQ